MFVLFNALPLTHLPSVAIVILNWNGRGFLEKFLPSVKASVYPDFRIIVADNASQDDSVSFLQKSYPDVELILNAANEGFAKGYNAALTKISADYCILLNNDVEVTPGWMEPIITLMEADKTIAACQPKVLSYGQKNQFEYAGACGGFIDTLGYPFTRGRIFDTCEDDHGQYESVRQIFWATGAALFIRTAVFHELNGFDEIFFAHQEEIDLCWRAQRKGYSVYVVPSSVVYHVGGGTLPMNSRRKVFLNFRNNLIMMSKNLSFPEKLWKIPLRILLDGIAAYKYLIGGDFSTFISIASAQLHYAEWLFARKQKDKLPGVKMKNMPAVYNGSIVWQYFVKHRKTFSEIISSKK
ncbi:MAG TPA: glycosyltransferase family 2 protein [Chitinophagaceae bacterium]|nr:glycosyltransferase family 2 protein [Chitinophagaceae bacterium]